MTVEWSRAANGDEKINGRYQRFKNCIGKGSFKTVYEAFDKTAQKDVAWNVVDLSQVTSGEELVKIKKETEILKSLKHKNILSIYDTWLNESRDRLIFITDIMRDGSLLKYILNRDITLGRVKEFCRQILNALCYLHRGIGMPPKPVIHRDLKCDNIFIDAPMNRIVLGDLGLSVVVSQKPIKGQSVVGTPEFMAPEMYEEKYNTKVDIYAFGMCLLQMITKKYPYQECHTLHQVYKKVTRRELPAVFKTVLSKSVKEYIVNCCQYEQEYRPSANQLLQHPFLNLQYPNDDLSCSVIVAQETEKIEDNSTAPILKNQTNNLRPIDEGVLPVNDAQLSTHLLVEPKKYNEPVNRRHEGDDQANSVQAPPTTQFTYRSDQSGSTKSVYSMERSAQIVRAEKYEDTGHFRIFLKIICEMENNSDGRSNLAMKSVSFDYTPGEDTPQSIAREMVTDLGLTNEMLATIEDVLCWENINEQLRIVQSDQATSQMARDVNLPNNEQILHERTSPTYGGIAVDRRHCQSGTSRPNLFPADVSNLSQIQQTPLPNLNSEQTLEDSVLNKLSNHKHSPDVIWQKRVESEVVFDGNRRGISEATLVNQSDKSPELLKTRDQHVMSQASQRQLQQYNKSHQNYSTQALVGQSQQAVVKNNVDFSCGYSGLQEADYGHSIIEPSVQSVKTGSNYSIIKPTHQTSTASHQIKYFQRSQANSQCPSGSLYQTALPARQHNWQQSPQTHEQPEYFPQSKTIKSYQQVSNHPKIQPSYRQIQTLVDQNPIISLNPPNSTQNTSQHVDLSIQTEQYEMIPFDGSKCQPFQPKIHSMQHYGMAPKEFSALQKSFSDQVDIPAESQHNDNRSKLPESTAVNHRGNQPLIPTALAVNKHNKSRAEVISGLLCQELIPEKNISLVERQTQTALMNDSLPVKRLLDTPSTADLLATEPRKLSSTISSPEQVQLDLSGKKILPPTHPRKTKQLFNLLPIDIKKTRLASKVEKAYTAPNSSGTDPPSGLLAIKSPTHVSSDRSSRDRALSEPGSPRKLHRKSSGSIDEEKISRNRAEQERLSKKIKPKRQISTKQTKKEQIKKKILEEQKKLSDNTLVGKDAKSAKGKEGSLTKTLTKKTITSANEDIATTSETFPAKSDIPDDITLKGRYIQGVKPKHSTAWRRLEWLKISRCPPHALGRRRESMYRSLETSEEKELQETKSKPSRNGSEILDTQSKLEQVTSADGFSVLNVQRQTDNAMWAFPPTPPLPKDKAALKDLKPENDFNSKVEKHLTTINRKLTDNRQKVMSEYRQRLDEINEHMELWYNNEREKTIEPERRKRINGHLSNFKTQFESMKEDSKDFENHIGLQMPTNLDT